MDDGVEPHVVRLRDGADGWRETDGPRLTPDAPYLTGLDEARADALVRSNWALEHATVEDAREYRYGTDVAPFDPSELTVDDLADRLDAGEYSADELDALAEREQEGKDRATAHDAIGAARDSGED